MHLGGKFWAQKGRGMGAGEARPLCFCRWSRPSTSELEPGRSGSEGGGGGFARRADSSGSVGSREVSRESVGPLGSTRVLTRAQEGRSRLKRGRELLGGQEQDRPSGQPGGGAQSQPEAALGAQEVWGYRGISSKVGTGSWTGTGSPGASRDQGTSRLPRGWCSEGRGTGEGSTRKPRSYLLALNPEAPLPVLITFSSQTRLLRTCLTREPWELMIRLRTSIYGIQRKRCLPSHPAGLRGLCEGEGVRPPVQG